MMHGKSGDTVNRGPVNRGLTVLGIPEFTRSPSNTQRQGDATGLTSPKIYIISFIRDWHRANSPLRAFPSRANRFIVFWLNIIGI